MKLKSIAAAALALAALATTASAQATMASVGVYDAATNANIVDLNNVAAPLTYPLFTAGLPGAWAVNRGGVANFDQPNTAPWPALAQTHANVRYGAGFVNNLLMSFSNPASITLPLGGAVPISGNGVLRVPVMAPGVPFTIKLNPSNAVPLRRVGLTVLQQQTQQTIRVNWIQSGGPTLAASATPALGPIPTRDICFARQATVAGGIVAVQIYVTQAGTVNPIAFNIDDIGFQH